MLLSRVNEIIHKYVGKHYVLNDNTLYQSAFTYRHDDATMKATKTGTRTNKKYTNNTHGYQRLEYLGDLVIKLSFGHYLFKRFPKELQGFITHLKIKLEEKTALAELSNKTGLVELIHGKHENDTISVSLLEDVFECFIGALFLDLYNQNGNLCDAFNKCYALLIRIIEEEVDIVDKIAFDTNYKAQLLRTYHKLNWNNPLYEVISVNTTGSTKMYTVGVLQGIKTTKNIQNDKVMEYIKSQNIKVEHIGFGISDDEKMAEQLASKDAMEYLHKHGYLKNVNIKYKLDEIDDPINTRNKKIAIDNIRQIYDKVGLTISNDINVDLFQTAFVHESMSMDNKSDTYEYKHKMWPQSSSRLNFLGDIVAKLVLGLYLFNRYNKSSEGVLTQIKTILENENTYSKFAVYLGLDNFLIISKQVEDTMGRMAHKILDDLFESFVGITFLMFGIDHCNQLIINLIETQEDIPALIVNNENYKQQLLELYHGRGWKHPIYKDFHHEGTLTHGLFYVYVLSGDTHMPLAWAYSTSKINAEQLASKKAIEMLRKN